jgi:putative membrane protein
MLNLLLNIIPFAFVVRLQELLPVVLTTIIFVLIGLVVFAVAFVIVVKITPFSVKKEIEDDQNIALAIIIGAIIIGVAMIISSAIQGDSSPAPSVQETTATVQSK